MSSPQQDYETKKIEFDESEFNDFDTDRSGWLVGSFTSEGMVRTNNEDAVYTFFSKLDSDVPMPTFGIFIIADGAGGHENGEVASSVTVRVVSRILIQDVYLKLLDDDDSKADMEPITDVVKRAIKAADERVREAAPDGGCTCTVGVINENTLTVGHVGDSRLYLINDDKIEKITRDHSVVQRLLELEQITPDQVKNHPQSSVLYRGLGMGEAGKLEVDIQRKRLKYGDHVLICSDGLWDMLEDSEIHRLVVTANTPQEACKRLAMTANVHGGRDNVSILLVSGPDS